MRIPFLGTLAAGLVASTFALGVQAAEPIKIVALYNLTGGMSSLDQPSLNGAKLQAKMINDAGGLLGGRMIEVVPIDTKTDQKETATAAKRAVGMEDVTAGIGYSDTTFVLAAAPLFQDAGIPFVTSGATSPLLPEMVGDMLFLVPFGDNIQAYAMAEYVYNTMGIHDVVVWTDNGMDYTTGLSKYFQERFEKLGGNIVLNDVFLTGDRDFSAQVARLQANQDKAGAVFVAAGPDEAGIIVKQIREAGIDMPILGGDGFDTPLVGSVPGEDLANDVYFTTHAYADLESEAIKTFQQGYKEAYGTDPENAFAALGYDAVGLLADAIKRAGSTDHEKLRDALASTDGYEGVTGTISYENGSRVPLKTVAVMKVENGDFSLVTTMTPSAE
ncbi:MAG TPA: ABC transporter substrate-binding protein [Hyphomicrobiaceae bacterium]